jgi:hypothetical protein
VEIVAHNRTARVIPEKAGGEMEGEIEVEEIGEEEDKATLTRTDPLSVNLIELPIK